MRLDDSNMYCNHHISYICLHQCIKLDSQIMLQMHDSQILLWPKQDNWEFFIGHPDEEHHD